MAAPETANIDNLTGVWTMNKELSDEFDPILALQGINFIKRGVIKRMTVFLHISQEKEADGTTVISIYQPGIAGFEGTQEVRRIPAVGADKIWRDHKDHVFGEVKGYSEWKALSDLKDDDDTESFLKTGWLEAPHFLESYVESVGNGWVARQLWGFEDVKGERRYVRHAVVTKGSEVKRARLVYDYKPDVQLIKK